MQNEELINRISEDVDKILNPKCFKKIRLPFMSYEERLAFLKEFDPAEYRRVRGLEHRKNKTYREKHREFVNKIKRVYAYRKKRKRNGYKARKYIEGSESWKQMMKDIEEVERRKNERRCRNSDKD